MDKTAMVCGVPRRPIAIWVLIAVYGFSNAVCWILGVILLPSMGVFLSMILMLSGSAFLRAWYDVATRSRGAQTLGLVLSSAVLVFFLFNARSVYKGITYWLRHPQPDSTGAILVSGLTLLAANAACLYYLTRPHVKAYLNT